MKKRNMKKKHYKDTMLHVACLEGVDKVNEVLKKAGEELDINAVGLEGNTALHMACMKNDPDIVKALLEYGGSELDINKANNDQWTPLHIACNLGYVYIVKMLLSREDVNVNLVNRDGHTPLHLVRNVGVAKLLLGYPHMRVDVNAKDREGSTPLKIMCFSAGVDLVNMILYYPYVKVRINEQDNNGFTALHMACGRGNKEIVKALMEYPEEELDWGVASKDGVTVLHTACSAGNADIVRMLLESSKVDMNKLTQRGVAALHIATTRSNINVIKELLKKAKNKESVDITNNRDRVTPLQIACKNGKLDIVKVFVDASADVNAVNTDGCAALHVACEEGHMDIIEFLIEKESTNMNLLNRNDETPLHIACREEYGKIVEMLFRRNDVNVNANRKGNTPLCVACRYGYVKVVEKLLERDDIDITIVPNKTGNITKLVKGAHKEHIIEMLKERAQSELMGTCEEGNIARVGKLVNIVGDVPNDELIRLINVSNRDIIKFFINKFGVEKMGQVLMEVDEESRDSMIEIMAEAKDVLKKVEGESLTLIENKILDRVEKARTVGDDIYIRQVFFTGIDMAKVIKENKTDVKRISRDIDKIDDKDILIAVKAEDIKWVKRLLKRGCNLEMKDAHGKNALMIAIEKKNMNIVKAILEKGINIEMRDDKGKSALMIAIENNYIDGVNILLNNGADINAMDNNNRNVLMYALRCGESMSFLINSLLSRDAIVEDNDGVTLLMHACAGGYMNAIRRTLELGIDINAMDAYGRTAVGMAYSKNDMELAEYLMKQGAVSPGNMSRDKKDKFRKLVHKVSIEDRLGKEETTLERREVVDVEQVEVGSRRNKKKNKGKQKSK